jgi:hypothetical protein
MIALPGRAPPRTVIGVDFSGADDAGRRIWVARGAIDGDSLRIDECMPASRLPGGGLGRDRAIAALVAWLAAHDDAIAGLDFPFGLPAPLVREKDWRGFVDGFARRFASPAALRKAAQAAMRRDGEEAKRRTDLAAKTPFSPVNLRCFRLTWGGIAGVLAPLLRDGKACVLPMQAPAPGLPILIETCPACVLKAEGLYFSYKGRSSEHRIARNAILSTLVARGALQKLPAAIERAALSGIDGDALDSIVAAVGAHRALYDPRLIEKPDELEAIEGRVLF